MREFVTRGIVVTVIVFALLGQAPTTGMTLAERVKVADFVGVVHIQSIHPSPNAGQPDEQRQDWSLQTADAVAMKTIKGVNLPSHFAIHFDYGQQEQSPATLYQPDADYFVFLAIEIPGGFSTCEQGQYAIHGGAINGWPGAAGPVALEVAQDAVSKLVPR